MTFTSFIKPHIHTQYDIDFLKLRNSILPAAQPTITATTPLTVQGLYDITTVVNGKDLAQIAAEKQLNTNIIYFMDDNLRTTVLNVDKPVLNAQIQAIVADPAAQAWYQSVTVPWLAMVVSNAVTTFTINTDILQGDLNVLFQNRSFITQSTLLYHYFYVTEAPTMSSYLADIDSNWLGQFITYLTSQTFLSNWPVVVQQTPQPLVTMMQKNIVAKLDLLDPSGASSNQVMYLLTQSLVLAQIYENVDEVTRQAAFESALKQALDDVTANPNQSNYFNQIRQLVTIAGGSASLATQLVGAYQTLTKQVVAGASTPASVGQATLLTGANALTADVRTFLTNPATLASCREILGTLFLVAAGVSLAFGFYNWNNADSVSKSRLTISMVPFVLSILTMQSTEGLLTVLCHGIADYIYGILRAHNITEAGVEAWSNAFKMIFGARFQGFIQTRVMPIFIAVNIGFLIYDMVGDANTHNWPALTMDAFAVIFTALQLIATVANVAGWSGPIATVCSIVAAIFIALKMFVFTGPTPTEVFRASLPTRYTDLTLKVYNPATTTPRAVLTVSGTTNYVRPSATSASNLTSSGPLPPYADPLRTSFLGNTGQLAIQCPFNSLTTVNSSFLSCRTENLIPYGTASGPAMSTEMWLLLVAPGTNAFYIMASDSKYIFIQASGDLKLSTNKKTAFTFGFQDDWFDPSTNLSLLFGSHLTINSYISKSGGQYAIAFVASGVYVITVPPIVNGVNPLDQLAAYITAHPTCIVYNMSGPITQTLSSTTFLKIRPNGIPVLKDGKSTKMVLSSLVPSPKTTENR
eukprot:gene6695-7786_t